MIPRVAKLGYGFAGAGAYYLHDRRDKAPDTDRPTAEEYHLHDKAGAQTSHRVGFTATRNLPTEDPHKALKCMSWLAANARNVRQAAVAAAAKAAGMSYLDYVRETNPYRGNKGKKPLYSLSIAWHPSKNKKPSQAQMLAAADEVLKALKLQDRQALIIEHKDTRHPHIHLIVNRVSPETGLFAKLPNDWLTLSRWAMDYEKRTGLVLCKQRVENWKKRGEVREDKAERRKTNPAAKGTYVLAENVPRRDHEWFRSVAHLPPDQIRQARAARQEREREQLNRKIAGRDAAVEARLARRYGPLLQATEKELDRLRRAEVMRKRMLSDPAQLIGQPREALQALFDLATARAWFRPRAIVKLESAADALRCQMGAIRNTEAMVTGRAASTLQARHKVERKRDEDRIAALARAAGERGTADRVRKFFNLTGNTETARFVSPKQAIVTLADIHAKVAKTAEGSILATRSALARVARSLGSAIRPDELRRKTIGGWTPPAAPQPATPSPASNTPTAERKTATDASGDAASIPAAAENQTDAQHRPASKSDRADFETKRDRKLQEIQKEKKERPRRQRERPRGKTRRME